MTYHPFTGLLYRGYSVIYADPPWQFYAWSHRGDGRGASQHYNVMPLNEIKSLPVYDIAADDSVLFLWVVQPMLPLALEVIEAWGFEFKTVAYCWVKSTKDGSRVRKGLGYHTRAGMEQCWLAVRGNGYKRVSQGESQVIIAPLREHSRKPDQVAESIVRLTGDLPRIELFARGPRDGWQVWGKESSNG